MLTVKVVNLRAAASKVQQHFNNLVAEKKAAKAEHPELVTYGELSSYMDRKDIDNPWGEGAALQAAWSAATPTPLELGTPVSAEAIKRQVVFGEQELERVAGADGKLTAGEVTAWENSFWARHRQPHETRWETPAMDTSEQVTGAVTLYELGLAYEPASERPSPRPGPHRHAPGGRGTVDRRLCERDISVQTSPSTARIVKLAVPQEVHLVNRQSPSHHDR